MVRRQTRRRAQRPVRPSLSVDEQTAEAPGNKPALGAEGIRGYGGPQLVELPPASIEWRDAYIKAGYNEEQEEELRQSIASHGQQAPIQVVQLEGEFFGTGGYHRCQAAIANGEPTIMCLVREGTWDDVLRANYASALHQQEADPLSTAMGLYHDHQEGVELATLALWSNKTVEWVERMLLVAQADPGVHQALAEQLIALGHAELIARLEDHAEQRDWLYRLLKERLTVRELGALMVGSETAQGESPAPHGTRRSQATQTCTFCHRECASGESQTLQVCDGCGALQRRDRELAALVIGAQEALTVLEQQLASNPGTVWHAELVGKLLEVAQMGLGASQPTSHNTILIKAP